MHINTLCIMNVLILISLLFCFFFFFYFFYSCSRPLSALSSAKYWAYLSITFSVILCLGGRVCVCVCGFERDSQRVHSEFHQKHAASIAETLIVECMCLTCGPQFDRCSANTRSQTRRLCVKGHFPVTVCRMCENNYTTQANTCTYWSYWNLFYSNISLHVVDLRCTSF